MNGLQYVLDALSLGGLYAMAALGIGLIFGVMRLINFAYGDYITCGAYALVIPSAAQVATPFIGTWDAPFLAAAVIAIVVALALLSERFAFRPLRDAEPATLLVSSFAVSYLLQNIILLVHGGRPKSINLWPRLTVPVHVGQQQVPLVDLITIVVCLGALTLVACFLKFTRLGIEIRAASENLRMASLLGIRSNRVIALAFGISGVLAAITALLIVVKTGKLDYRLGVPVTIVGFMATVVGGMGGLIGPAIGGGLIGVATVVLQATLPEGLRNARDAFLFGFVLLLLVLAPRGLIPARSQNQRV